MMEDMRQIDVNGMRFKHNEAMNVFLRRYLDYMLIIMASQCIMVQRLNSTYGMPVPSKQLTSYRGYKSALFIDYTKCICQGAQAVHCL